MDAAAAPSTLIVHRILGAHETARSLTLLDSDIDHAWQLVGVAKQWFLLILSSVTRLLRTATVYAKLASIHHVVGFVRCTEAAYRITRPTV